MLLASCSAGGEGVDTTLTVYSAKAVAQATEMDIADVIPADDVERVEQSSSGVLMSCSSEGVYHWSGRTKVFLQGEPDVTELIQAIVEEYSDRDGFSALLGETADGWTRATIAGQHGASYVVDPWDDGARIEISSYSPSFRLADDQSPLTAY